MNRDMIKKAREFALDVHGDQTYGEGLPYVYHLDDVFHRWNAFYNEAYGDIEYLTSESIWPIIFVNVGVTCYLHDTVEDGKCPDSILNQIRMNFGPYIATYVSLLSKNDENVASQTSKLAKNTVYFRRCNDTNVSRYVKIFDRLANISACRIEQKTSLLKKYIKEYPAFHAIFYSNAPKERDLWIELDNLHKEI